MLEYYVPGALLTLCLIGAVVRLLVLRSRRDSLPEPDPNR